MSGRPSNSSSTAAPSYGLLQQKRRDEALVKQKYARSQQFNLARIVQAKGVRLSPLHAVDCAVWFCAYELHAHSIFPASDAEH
jgi:hypothetical protein